MVKLVEIRVYGGVQGVFFRESARQEARKLGLGGFARNEADESVYIEAEGGEDDLKKFVDWCRQGPEMAKVGRLDIEYSSDLKFYKDFEIG